MSRLSYIIVIFFAILAIAAAQGSSSSSTGVESSSSSVSSSALSSSSSESSSSAMSSSSESSSSAMSSSSSAMFSSSSESSSSMLASSSSSSAGPNFIPSNWNDITVLDNDTSIFVTWETKTPDNLMHGFGTPLGFSVNNVSGGPLHVLSGFVYNFTLDATAASHGLYFSYDPEGNNPLGSNISQPITTPGSNFVTIPYLNNNTVVFLYYASADTPFAGGAVIIGKQSAAALQASFAIMIISAFVSLVFPKW